MNYKNGMRNTSEYMCWSNMKYRCTNPEHKSYKYYGARGITIHPDFLLSNGKGLINWFNHIGPRPSMEYSQDRIDNNGDYTYGNIRWATKKEQNNNKREQHNAARHGTLHMYIKYKCRCIDCKQVRHEYYVNNKKV